jgi:hypothetical protein
VPLAIKRQQQRLCLIVVFAPAQICSRKELLGEERHEGAVIGQHGQGARKSRINAYIQHDSIPSSHEASHDPRFNVQREVG